MFLPEAKMAAIVASLPEKCLCGEVEEFAFRGVGRHQLNYATEARLHTESNLYFEALCW